MAFFTGCLEQGCSIVYFGRVRCQLLQFSSGLGGDGYGPPGGGSSTQWMAARNNPKFRTGLCVTYMTRGHCEQQFTSCMFAHGEDELANKDTYKTVMCKYV